MNLTKCVKYMEVVHKIVFTISMEWDECEVNILRCKVQACLKFLMTKLQSTSLSTSLRRVLDQIPLKGHFVKNTREENYALNVTPVLRVILSIQGGMLRAGWVHHLV